jgi:hypothetical protein
VNGFGSYRPRGRGGERVFFELSSVDVCKVGFCAGDFFGSVFCFAVRMKWFDKLFGSSGSSHDYDGEGYYYGHPPPYNSGGWNGPDFFSVPTY